MEITVKIMIITAIRFPTNALTGLIISNLSRQIISNSFSLFSETNYSHSFGNEQRFEDFKDSEPTNDKDDTIMNH